MSDEFDPVILPIIRNVLPDIIAQDICRVQPMGSSFKIEEWPYQIDVLPFAKYTDVIPMKQWCRETLNDGEWDSTVQFFAFKNEEALTWFKLRWL